jgi:ankyrin repeat protein
MDEGHDINARDKDGWTPLHHAVDAGHIGVVKLFLSKGAHINAMTKDGKIPLQIAMDKGHKEIEQVLSEHKALR